MKVRALSSAVGFGDWLGLYVTGVFLVFFLGAHIWAVHYAATAEAAFTFESVRQKLQSPLFTFLDLGLLCLALYHGLTGLRRFVADLEVLSTGAMKVFTWGLVALGLAGLYYGWLIYRAFVG